MGGGEDKPENYQTVTYELDGHDGETVLTLKQDNNPTEEAAETMAEKNWGPVLEGLKNVAEEARSLATNSTYPPVARTRICWPSSISLVEFVHCDNRGDAMFARDHGCMGHECPPPRSPDR
jgi:hypothetical protein